MLEWGFMGKLGSVVSLGVILHIYHSEQVMVQWRDLGADLLAAAVPTICPVAVKLNKKPSMISLRFVYLFWRWIVMSLAMHPPFPQLSTIKINVSKDAMDI